MKRPRESPEGTGPTGPLGRSVREFAVVGGLVLGDEVVPGAVIVRDGRIDGLQRSARRDGLPPHAVEADIVAPGLIDLQVNGGFGEEVSGDPNALRRLAARLPETGVTSFLPTVITSPADVYRHAFDAFDSARDAHGARALGLHLEGPFLSPRRPGAHRLDLIDGAPDPLFDEVLGAEHLRLMTLAPEREGGNQRIRRLRKHGVVVSLGHTDATVEEFAEGVDAGATMATHLYNAMSSFGHRAPGAIGAALVDDRVVVGLIADGVHCHPASLRLAVGAKGPERIALVTDMMSAAGMPPGTYELGGRRVEVDGVSARLPDGTLAGAVLTMDRAIRNMVRWAGVSPATAIRMATEVPARILGLGAVGQIEVGARANLALLTEDLRVEATIVDGEVVFRREGQ